MAEGNDEKPPKGWIEFARRFIEVFDQNFAAMCILIVLALALEKSGLGVIFDSINATAIIANFALLAAVLIVVKNAILRK